MHKLAVTLLEGMALSERYDSEVEGIAILAGGMTSYVVEGMAS